MGQGNRRAAKRDSAHYTFAIFPYMSRVSFGGKYFLRLDEMD